MTYEGLDGGGAGGGGAAWNSLISEKLAHYSLSLKCKMFAYSLKIIHYSLKC